jgi:ubiquinone/menaquinone biosynthesis C-methylase UbiE
MIHKYFKNLYQRTMNESYSLALAEISIALKAPTSKCLDCGAHSGYKYTMLKETIGLQPSAYNGIEWNKAFANEAQQKGLNVLQGDLNKTLPYDDNTFECVFGLSVLEHLLNPCKFLKESYRVLNDGGTLIILTPNISTFFTAALILMGKMPSSGPHPDSDELLKKEELFKVSSKALVHDTETDTPVHRHLVVFSYRVLMSYIKMLGFKDIKGYGFGLYPFPNFMQPVLEKNRPLPLPSDGYCCSQIIPITIDMKKSPSSSSLVHLARLRPLYRKPHPKLFGYFVG